MAANGVILPPTFFRADVRGGRPTFSAGPYGGMPVRRLLLTQSLSSPLAARRGRRCRRRRRRGSRRRHQRRTRPSAPPSSRPRPPTKAPGADARTAQPVIGFEATNLGREKSVVLAVDRSQSMRGQAMQDATAAARAFVRAKPASDRIAVVAVGKRAVQLTGFSSGTPRPTPRCARLEVDTVRGTALYDAVVLVVAVARGRRQRRPRPRPAHRRAGGLEQRDASTRRSPPRARPA